MNHKLKWPLVKLSTLAVKDKNALVGGPFGSDLVSSDYVPEGVPVVRGTNLPKNAMFSCVDFVFVSERKADSLHLNCAKPGDIVFTQRGTLGQVGLLPKNTPYSRFLISQSQMKMTVDPTKADAFYLYYYFRLPSTVKYIENHALQSGVPHINLGILRKFDVVYPPLPVQQKIAAVLSAYDDLIENNKRRIALLEKMAEEIYREWFVRLRFPGHGSVKVVKGVPEGWTVSKVKSIVSRLPFGKIYRESELFEEGKIIVIDQSQSDFLGCYDGEPEHNATSDKPIILFGDHSCKLLLMTKPFSLAENVVPFVSKGEMPTYFLFHLIKGLAETTEYKRHWTEFTNKEVYVPPEPLQKKFQGLVSPFYQQMELLKESIRLTSKTRDMLLTRLISGKLSVENLDIQFPPGMAP